MPRTSERQRLLQDIDEVVEQMVLDDEGETVDFADIIELQSFVESNRYLSNRGRIPKNASMNDMLWIWPEDSFKQEVRMGRIAFVRLVNLIQDHEAFKNNAYKKAL